MLHGALALDPRNFNGTVNATEAATALHYAAIEAGRFIQSLEPEVLVLLTPHGLSLPDDFLLYNNPTAVGSVSVDAWLPCSFPPCAYNVSANLDVHLTKHLETALAGCGGSVTSLSGFGPPSEGTLPLPLAWAEVIPLYFIGRAYESAAQQQQQQQPAGTARKLRATQQQQVGRRPCLRSLAQRHPSTDRGGEELRVAEGGGSAAATTTTNNAGSPNASMPQLVILSMPSRRYEHSVQMIPELLALGEALFSQLDSLDERIAVVVSGDLAHTWDPAGPYGFSEHAARFDGAVTQWARDLDRGALLKVAAKSVGEAKSCGFPGMVLLQGMMDGVKPDDMHSVLLDYGHPSYYGMMCAVFDFQGDA